MLFSSLRASLLSHSCKMDTARRENYPPSGFNGDAIFHTRSTHIECPDVLGFSQRRDQTRARRRNWSRVVCNVKTSVRPWRSREIRITFCSSTIANNGLLTRLPMERTPCVRARSRSSTRHRELLFATRARMGTPGPLNAASEEFKSHSFTGAPAFRRVFARRNRQRRARGSVCTKQAKRGRAGCTRIRCTVCRDSVSERERGKGLVDESKKRTRACDSTGLVERANLSYLFPVFCSCLNQHLLYSKIHDGKRIGQSVGRSEHDTPSNDRINL